METQKLRVMQTGPLILLSQNNGNAHKILPVVYDRTVIDRESQKCILDPGRLPNEHAALLKLRIFIGGVVPIALHA